MRLAGSSSTLRFPRTRALIYRAFCCGLALLALCLTVTAASAQQLATITPPRLKRDSAAAYPEQAMRERFFERVSVALVLQIDSDGRVQQVSVLEPRGHGFDEAAVEAARGLLFEPATRDGRPIAARIKYQYQFTPPPPRLSGRVAGNVSDLPIRGASISVRDATGTQQSTKSGEDGSFSIDSLAPGRAHLRVTAPGMQRIESDETLAPGEVTHVVLRLSVEPLEVDSSAPPELEVVVSGDRPPREVSKRTLNRDEIRHSAGTMGDALLSLQNLPGVARPPPFSGALAVRGSAPDDTNVLIDGTNVPLIYHFGGLSSAVPSELLDKIDFYPGNYSAIYGRGMGGLIEVRLREPKKDAYRLLLENSFLGLRLLAEGPLGKGWSFFASGQRSWLDVLAAPLLDDQIALPVWGDYQVALHKDLGAHSSFRLLFFGSDDAFKLVNPIANAANPGFSGRLGYHTNFWRLQARFESRLSEGTHFRLTSAYGLDALDLSLGTIMQTVGARPLSGRAELSQQLGRGVVGNIGVDLLYEPYDLVLQLPPPTRAGRPDGGPGQPALRSARESSLFLPSAYAELEILPWRGGRAVPGARVDYDSGTRRWDFSPRLSLRQDLTSGFPRTTLKGGIGYYFQPPNLLQTDAVYGERGLSSNRSLHASVGFEQEFTRNLELSVDGFYKKFDHLVVPGAGNAGSGAAYGVEWLLRYKPDGRFFGWISYTLSRSERRDLAGEPLLRFQYDQTHVLTLLGNVLLGRGWQLGARFRLSSGDLRTPLSTGAYNATSGSQLGVAAYPPFATRLPTFHQLDIRIERSKQYRYFRMTHFLDLQNAYFANNPFDRSYNYNYTKSSFVQGLPILPVLGVRLELP